MKTSTLASILLIASFSQLNALSAPPPTLLPPFVAGTCGENYVGICFFGITAATSPNANESNTNVFQFLDKGILANGPEAYKTNPGALHLLEMFRASEAVSSPASYKMHDGTNSPAFPFSEENGGRIGVGLLWNSATPLYLREIGINLHSSDTNTFNFQGNLGSNGTSVATWSRTSLVGELWENGALVARYTTGPATQKVTRVVAVVRVTFFCSSPSVLADTLAYLGEHMPYTAYASFFKIGSNGYPTCTYRSELHSASRFTQTSAGQVFNGQRNLPNVVATLLERDDNNKPWTTNRVGLRDGEKTPVAKVGSVFFTAREDRISLSPLQGKSQKAAPQVQIQVEIGGE